MINARRLPANHGIVWLAAGFALYRRNPPILIALTFAYLLTVILVSLIPVAGSFLLPLMLPTLTVLLANGCRAIQTGQPLPLRLLSSGLTQQRQVLVQLGGLHLLGSTVLVLISLGFGTQIDVSDGLSPEEASQLLSEVALMLALAAPLLMAFWFAPLLAVWDNIPAVKSVFFSFVASWRNWRAFSMYGLALTVVGIVLPGLILAIAGMISPIVLDTLSTLLRMLMIFVLAPTLVASVYLSYRDVFAPPHVDEHA